MDGFHAMSCSIYLKKGDTSKVMALFLGEISSCDCDYIFDLIEEKYLLNPYMPELCAKWDALSDAELTEREEGFDLELYHKFQGKVFSPKKIKEVNISCETYGNEGDEEDEAEIKKPHLGIDIDFRTGEVKQKKLYW